MGRILFGKRAIKKEKKEEKDETYPAGGHVLGVFYSERTDSIKFKLPNGRTGVVYKKTVANEIEKEERDLKQTIKQFKKDIYVELLVLGTRAFGYECAIFTQKKIKENSIVTGIIEGKEEIGYSVAVGVMEMSGLLKTEENYAEGSLGIFQVKGITPNTYMLSDRIDREIYIGDKEEVSPGILVRTRITGRPKYIMGQKKQKYTNMHYTYTAEGLTVGNLVVESKEEIEEETEKLSIIVYTSEDKKRIHAVPYDEFSSEIDKKIPGKELIGTIHAGTVVSIKEQSHSIIRIEDGSIGVLKDAHYSDISRKGSKAPFSEGDSITVRIFNINGYFIFLTAKESLLKESNRNSPLEKGDSAVAVVDKVCERYLKCMTVGEKAVYIRKVNEIEAEIGAVYTVTVKGHMKESQELLGSLKAPDQIRKDQTKKDKKTDKTRKDKKKKLSEMEPEEREIEQKKRNDILMKNIKRFSNGQIVKGKIVNIHQYGAFARIAPEINARIKIGEISSMFVKDWSTLVKIGQSVKMVLYDIDYEIGRVEGSIKRYEVLESIESAPHEDMLNTAAIENQPEPIGYGIEEEEESESEEEENDPSLQMELFNSKDGIFPWKKRMESAPLSSLLKIFSKAMEYTQSPDAKSQLCIIYTSCLCALSDKMLPEYSSPIEEGIKRDGTIYLKKVIDIARNSRNRELYKMACHRFIKHKKDSPFGYKELIHASKKDGSIEELRKISEIISKSELKTLDKKLIEISHIEALYSLSKNEGRTAIEKHLANPDNKNKEEWTVKYLALEINSISKKADILYTRNVLNKSVNSKDISEGGIKGIFKTYLKFEKEFGTKEKEEAVLEMAKTYVSKLSK